MPKIEDSDYLLCTGLFDENQELEFYKNILSSCKDKDMICTNPDLIVDRGKPENIALDQLQKYMKD